MIDITEHNKRCIENGNEYAKTTNFVCPMGMNSCTCPTCDKMRPNDIWDDKKRCLIPIALDEQDCIEWKKKIWEGACGCGGHYECICGFKEYFCFPFGRTTCPYCGRDVKTILNKYYYGG